MVDRAKSGTGLTGRVTVRHTRRPHDNQGARIRRDQFLTQELTYFVLDTGEPAGTAGNGSPAHNDNTAHQNANIYLTGFYANGDPRPGEKIINVLSSFMNPVIIEAIDSEIVTNTRMVPVDPNDPTGAMMSETFNDPTLSSGNSRLLYFACEVDGLHWDSDDDANGNASGTYGELGANSASGNAEMSSAAQAIRAIREIHTDLASAKLSRGYFRVTTDTTDDID